MINRIVQLGGSAGKSRPVPHAELVEQRTFTVNVHPADLAGVSQAARLLGASIEEYLLIAAVQHARRVTLAFGDAPDWRSAAAQLGCPPRRVATD
ncbi:hypothetical protein [Burkholderia gladioli]|uniref:hypothetical protein n=1 Tax=Burkholderia gladioli TaxID=28095 RepID=UPI000FD7D55D|nr:hypothetical protein [Burkholderia gladioli]